MILQERPFERDCIFSHRCSKCISCLSLHKNVFLNILDKIVTLHNFIVSELILPITLHDGAFSSLFFLVT